jgi:ABC-2 type transport system ATP-binding protein
MRTRIRFRPPEGVVLPELGQVAIEGGLVEIRVEDPAGPLHELTGWARDHGVSLTSLEVTRPSLEDVYLEYTGGEEGTE